MPDIKEVSCKTAADARMRVYHMRLGSFVGATEEYLLALRKDIFDYLNELDAKIAEVQEPYEVWDEEYNGQDSDTSEVVFGGTREKCERFVNYTGNPRRFTIVKAGCD